MGVFCTTHVLSCSLLPAVSDIRQHFPYWISLALYKFNLSPLENILPWKQSCKFARADNWSAQPHSHMTRTLYLYLNGHLTRAFALPRCAEPLICYPAVTALQTLVLLLTWHCISSFSCKQSLSEGLVCGGIKSCGVTALPATLFICCSLKGLSSDRDLCLTSPSYLFSACAICLCPWQYWLLAIFSAVCFTFCD